MKIRIVISGRHYNKAESLPDTVDLPEGSTIDDALERLSGLLADGGSFPPTCLLGVAGKHVGTVGAHSAVGLTDGDELVIMAPVAGG